MQNGGAQQPWWHGSVLYQLYVRSWQDADGDGYGDLRGLLSRLDHLEWLGVDAIWLSPTMPSPDTDWGYDVSDYTDVHPELGSLADLDELIAAAGQRGMRVLLDLVPNHTSSAHAWFVDALTGRDAEYREYYVWADPAADGGPPNNWIDAAGQPAWTLDRASGQYYLHNFLATQPDLNWWLPAVHEEFRQILEFWFSRGVAGFRIDVAHGLYKDAQLRDNPPVTSDDPLEGRFGLQPVYNFNRPEVHGVYRDWRKLADSYDPARLLLGETWVREPAELAKFYGDNDELQLGFNFPFVFASFTAAGLAGVVAQTLADLPEGSCPVWTASNHDVGRFASRWCGGDEQQTRLALLILATLPGAMVLYYGDEIGMPDFEVPPELRRDVMTQSQDGPHGNRDRARTPMQWDVTASAGFTTSTHPWLPVGDAASCNVAAQREDPGSVLRLCQSLLALRKAEVGGQIAQYRELAVDGGLWAYQVGGLTVLANLSAEPVTWTGEPGEVLLATGGSDSGSAWSAGSAGITLSPWSGLIARTAA
jgi:alpha-glucosidase